MAKTEGGNAPVSVKNPKRKRTPRKPTGTQLYLNLIKGAREQAVEPSGEPGMPEIESVRFVPEKDVAGKFNGANMVIHFKPGRAAKKATPSREATPAILGVFMSMPILRLEDGSYQYLRMKPRRVRGAQLRPDRDEMDELIEGVNVSVELASIRIGSEGDSDSTYLLTQVPSTGRAEGIFMDVVNSLTDETVEQLRKLGVVYKKQRDGQTFDCLAIDLGMAGQSLQLFGRIGHNGAVEFQPGNDEWSLSRTGVQVDTTRGPWNIRGGPGTSSQRAIRLTKAIFEKGLGFEHDGQTVKEHWQEFKGTPKKARGVKDQLGFQAPRRQGGGRPGRMTNPAVQAEARGVGEF